jgi:nucleoside-diphosphate-sugar epimerase
MSWTMAWLILGFGYSAAAIASEVGARLGSVTVTARTPAKVERLRGEGCNALPFDGSAPGPELKAAIAEVTHLLVSVPPDEAGDPALVALGPALAAAPRLRRIAYLSTVGVYGDHGGAWIDEGTPVRPSSQRSRQRVLAEEGWRDLAAARGAELGIFRLSGIYGPGRSAIDNIRAGTARRIIKPGQVFNRIHRADIGGAVSLALTGDGPLGIFNLTDDEPAPPQDVVAHAAHLLGVPVPPDIPFEQAQLSEMGRSFYSENKRVSNARLKRELGYTFRCPTYREGLAACLQAA